MRFNSHFHTLEISLSTGSVIQCNYSLSALCPSSVIQFTCYLSQFYVTQHPKMLPVPSFLKPLFL